METAYYISSVLHMLSTVTNTSEDKKDVRQLEVISDYYTKIKASFFYWFRTLRAVNT